VPATSTIFDFQGKEAKSDVPNFRADSLFAYTKVFWFDKGAI